MVMGWGPCGVERMMSYIFRYFSRRLSDSPEIMDGLGVGSAGRELILGRVLMFEGALVVGSEGGTSAMVVVARFVSIFDFGC